MQGRLVVFQNVSAEKDLPHCTEVKQVCIAHYFLLTEVHLAVSRGKVSEGGVHLESIRHSQASLSVCLRPDWIAWTACDRQLTDRQTDHMHWMTVAVHERELRLNSADDG